MQVPAEEKFLSQINFIANLNLFPQITCQIQCPMYTQTQGLQQKPKPYKQELAK